MYFSVANLSTILSELTSNILQVLSPLEFKEVDDFHVSLSRTFVARHHWIEPLAMSLKRKLQAQEK